MSKADFWIAMAIMAGQLFVIIWLASALGRAHTQIERLKWRLEGYTSHELGRPRKERL